MKTRNVSDADGGRPGPRTNEAGETLAVGAVAVDWFRMVVDAVARRVPGGRRVAGSPPLTPTPSPGRSSGAGSGGEAPGLTLLEAASLGDGAAVARLLEQGEAAEDADGDGWTALVRAAAAGHEAIVRLLLDRGASVMPLFTQGHEAARHQANRSGRSTPLHYKELFGEASIVSMLVGAAAVALPSAKSESAANLLRSAEYGRVLVYLRALRRR